MTINEFIDYLKANPNSEYNMQSLVNTIDNLDDYKFSCIDKSVEYDSEDVYYIVIENREEFLDYMALYYKYTTPHSNNSNVFVHSINTVQPMHIEYYEGYVDEDDTEPFKKIYFDGRKEHKNKHDY